MKNLLFLEKCCFRSISSFIYRFHNLDKISIFMKLFFFFIFFIFLRIMDSWQNPMTAFLKFWPVSYPLSSFCKFRKMKKLQRAMHISTFSLKLIFLYANPSNDIALIGTCLFVVMDRRLWFLHVVLTSNVVKNKHSLDIKVSDPHTTSLNSSF